MFFKYFSIGILNTGIHWLIFGLCLFLFSTSQGSANLIAFFFAVTFSFFMNAKFTFDKKPTGVRYFLFMIFMGILNFVVGSLADHFTIYPIITLVVSSTLSLVLGFIYSKFIVFK